MSTWLIGHKHLSGQYLAVILGVPWALIAIHAQAWYMLGFEAVTTGVSLWALLKWRASHYL